MNDRNALRTIEIWDDTRGQAHCRGCNKVIIWSTVVASGRRMCFDNLVVLSEFTHPDNRRRVLVVDLRTNHWATCPLRESFRRR